MKRSGRNRASTAAVEVSFAVVSTSYASMVTGAFSCTKLDEKFNGDLTPDQVSGSGSSVSALLSATYATMQVTYQDQSNWLAMQEMTTDELVGPTRGPDWDDNGVWRVLHAHAWDADNLHIRECFDQMNATSFAATDLLQYSPSAQQAAEARFLRAYSMFNLLDGWDQVPYRDPGESVVIPSRVRKGTEALTYIMGQLTDSIIPVIAATPVYQANRDAAKFLLMKCYLNKGVIANRATPTFDNGDMAKVISLADEIIGTGKYPLATNYFDNFAPNNENIGSEDIWTFHRIAGQGTGGTGKFVSGSLEGSTTDIAGEFSNMIVAQRNYQSNAQMISTQKAITQTVIDMAR